MANFSILIHGATGETGGEIIEGLLNDGSYSISALVRPQSAEKPAVKALETRGIKIVLADTAKQNAEELATLLHGYDAILSAVAAEAQLEQLVLVDAAAKAGIKRFVPCGFTTVSPPGGVMDLRNQKERVHERIWYHHIPYTIIDVGFWYQFSWPVVPSGRLDHANLLPNTTIYGDGNAPNILTDKRDIGTFVARILKDERTLNKRVFTCSEVLSQNQVYALMEEKTGEKIQPSQKSEKETMAMMVEAKAAHEADPTNPIKYFGFLDTQYAVSKYVLRDSSPENAKYLGYLDARELYPDLKPISFTTFLDDLLAGKAMFHASKYREMKAVLEGSVYKSNVDNIEI